MRIDEVAHHPQLAHRRFFQSVETPFGAVTLPGAGFRLAHGSPGIDKPMALPGAHTDEILRSIGYDDHRIQALRNAAVI
jgi:crotonobetainyl-CoA:carnitine CoA-transferase CaiB-like acyl-CoA transferase